MYNVLTGFKFIGEVIEKQEKEGNRGFVLGFEESYGYLKGSYARDKDSVVAALLICEMAAYRKSVASNLAAASDELDEKYGGLGLDLRRKEGYAEGRWIVLDFANILVHIFHPEERQYYNMERLWIDTPDACINYSAEVSGN